MSVADQKFIDDLIEENRQQREIIRSLVRERIEVEKYWGNLLIEVVNKNYTSYMNPRI